MPSVSQAISTLLVLLTAMQPAASADPPPGQAIGLRPGAITTLAKSLIDADDGQRWEFADTLLDVLLNTYDEELKAAAANPPDTEKRRRKLYRWQHATQDLMAQLIDARLKLSEGANPIIHVDAQQQILLFIAEQTIAFSAPRPGNERRMETQVIERYCALNECSALDDAGPGSAPMIGGGKGTWAMQEHRLPAFEIDDLLHCTFADLRDRLRKQIACHEAAVEAKSLIDAVSGALYSGHDVDWRQLAAGRTVSGPDTQLHINAAGDYLRIGTPRLARIDNADWVELARWLRERIETGSGVLRIEQAGRLLYDK